MTMSRDRVKFTIPYNFGSQGPARQAFKKAFGVHMPSSLPWQGMTVICRPSQFARFLIYRNEDGGRNGFKELNATLVPATDIEILDVSKNSAEAG
jgi:hypothetical protein